MFLFRQPLYGWTVESLHKKICETYDVDLSIKSIRTFTNNLGQCGLIETVISKEDGRTKRLFLKKGSLTLEGAVNIQHKTAMAFIVSMMQSMKATDLSPLIDSMLTQLSYTFESYDDWYQILVLSRDFAWFHQSFFELSEHQLLIAHELLTKKQFIFSMELADQRVVMFSFSRIILRDGITLLTGVDRQENVYVEINLSDVTNISRTNITKPAPRLHPVEQNKLNTGHLSIGTPTGGQVYTAVLQLNEDCCSRLKNRPRSLDMELNEDTKQLIIYHELSEDLVDWIMGLGYGVVVIEPQELRESVYERLEMLTRQYA